MTARAEGKEWRLTSEEVTREGTEGEVDATVDAFIVKSVTTGTLRIGTYVVGGSV